jgi:hypothetical protein
MNTSISQLRSIWRKEADSYKIQEVGSGVQTFVRQVLECQDIFNLKEGALSTTRENRKNEYIYEKKTKGRRQADFVIYINSDIIIPIEVEQYTNIEQGEGQLSQYQSDLEKKYGILTDGYTWRFYNNSLYRIFTLDQLLSDTAYFLEFWKEYIKPEYYYLSFFEEVGQLAFFGKEELHIEDNRQLFFEDITTLIRSFRNKLRIEGYFNGLETKEALKKATEITYAYIIQFILYKTLVDNRFDDFGNDYKGRIETIRNAIKTKSYKDILGVIDGMSHQISENIYRPFVKEQEHIGGKLLKLYHEAKNELSDVSPWLDIVVFIKKYNFQNIHNEIFGYVYENYLKELYEDEKKGQYFTDPSVVNFMLEQVGYTAKEIRNRIKTGELDKLSIVDPACGSGTFLYSATDEVVKSFSTITDETSKQIEEIVTSNVFGLDVEEFPLYLAEMNILMRMLPLIMGEKYNNPLEKKIKVFLTKDSIAEFVGSELETTNADVSTREGQLSYFGKLIQPEFVSYVRDENDLKEMKVSMTSFPRRRFDYVIANPPYVRYNDCVRQGLLIFKMMKDGKVKLSNIYGVNLHSTPNNHKKYAPKPNLYAFFIALGLALLKENGSLCYIIPQTILVNPDFDVLRYHLSKNTTIQRIILFDTKMFVGRGLKQAKSIPTSSLVVIAKKKLPSNIHKVDIIAYRSVDKNEDIEGTLRNISDGINIIKNNIPQKELLLHLDNWNFITQDVSYLDFAEEYKNNTEEFSIYYEHVLAEQTFKHRFYFDGGAVIDDKAITQERNNAYEILEKLSEFGFIVPKSYKYYPKTAQLDFPQGSQGKAPLYQRYKVVWRTKNTGSFQYTDKEIMLVTNKYLMISSNNKREIFYLLSLLNSKVTRAILQGTVMVKGEDTNTILVSLRVVKEQIRVPIITGDNEYIKKEIVERTGEMLHLEENTLSDFVDFSGILMQKFDDVQVAGNTLVLVQDKQKMELQIKGDAELIATAIARNAGTEGLKLEKRETSLSELRNLQVIDFEKQAKLKDYIDDLVFALYCNIHLKDLSLERATDIKQSCMTNKCYKTVFFK